MRALLHVVSGDAVSDSGHYLFFGTNATVGFSWLYQPPSGRHRLSANHKGAALASTWPPGPSANAGDNRARQVSTLLSQLRLNCPANSIQVRASISGLNGPVRQMGEPGSPPAGLRGDAPRSCRHGVPLRESSQPPTAEGGERFGLHVTLYCRSRLSANSRPHLHLPVERRAHGSGHYATIRVRCDWSPCPAITLPLGAVTCIIVGGGWFDSRSVGLAAQLGTGFTGMRMQRTLAFVSRACHAAIPWQRARREWHLIRCARRFPEVDASSELAALAHHFCSLCVRAPLLSICLRRGCHW